MNRYVIIGNGTAAVGCIEGIRTVDKAGSITVISSENRPAYCRPLISYLLEDKTTEKKMSYRSDNFYSDNGCTVMYNTNACEIDTDKKCVLTDTSSFVPYDKLCIATGSSPFVPPMENLDKVEKKFSFLTLDDAVELKKTVTTSSKILIVGAGLIGLKCAEGLHAITKDITVCDLSDHILSSILDFDDAMLVQKHLERNGIKFSLHNSVPGFCGNTAVMQNGEEIEFDILVTAVGVRANISLFKNAGGQCTRGITVNEKAQTSLEDIYSAGDCTETTDISDGKTKIMALMPNAYMQGYTAGVNMAGGSRVFDNAIPMNSIGFFGMHLMTAGQRNGELSHTLSENAVKRLYFDNEHLVGYVLIGDVKNAGIYTKLIRERSPLDADTKKKMINAPTMELYDAQFRRRTLESVV